MRRIRTRDSFIREIKEQRKIIRAYVRLCSKLDKALEELRKLLP